MIIESSDRVVYQHNPLSEVVCQLRFKKMQDITDIDKDALREEYLAAGYPNFAEEITFGFVQQIVPNSDTVASPVEFPRIRIFHFSSVDNFWRISVCSEFVALTCLKYSGWSDFLPRLLLASRVFVKKYQNIEPLRIGLRYKDVIEREPLGLNGVDWQELIHSFLLGPLAPNALAPNQTALDGDVVNFLSHTLLRLESAMLLLQSSLLTSTDGERRAFLIDADFYNENEIEPELLRNDAMLAARLDSLHANAGALFRRGITERLHNALRPI